MDVPTEETSAGRRLVPLLDRSLVPTSIPVRSPPSACPEGCVSRLAQTVGQHHAADKICHRTLFSFVRLHDRHTGGCIIPFLVLWQTHCYRHAEKYLVCRSICRLEYSVKFCWKQKAAFILSTDKRRPFCVFLLVVCSHNHLSLFDS